MYFLDLIISFSHSLNFNIYIDVLLVQTPEVAVKPVYSGGLVDQQWLYYRGWPANTGPINTCYGDFGAH